MPEYRTSPIGRSLLLVELTAICDSLSLLNVVDVAVSFGWDSNLHIDDMWKDQIVSIKNLLAFIEKSEIAGVVQVGKADIFVQATEFVFTLCHEGDAHVEGRSELVQQFAQRWQTLGYSPYEVQDRT